MMLSRKLRKELQMLTAMEVRALTNVEAERALAMITAEANGSKCDGCRWVNDPEVCKIQCGEY